jgi:hypothetical protein
MSALDRFETAHGVCTIVALEDHDVEDAYAKLPAAERAHADSLGPLRRREMICGRTALHDALGSLEPNLATSPILADDRGAPVLPAGWVGSVSHKGALAAAIVAPAGSGWVGSSAIAARARRCGSRSKRRSTRRSIRSCAATSRSPRSSSMSPTRASRSSRRACRSRSRRRGKSAPASGSRPPAHARSSDALAAKFGDVAIEHGLALVATRRADRLVADRADVIG